MTLLSEGFRLPPPPGCSRALYELIIRCWYVCVCVYECMCLSTYLASETLWGVSQLRFLYVSVWYVHMCDLIIHSSV